MKPTYLLIYLYADRYVIISDNGLVFNEFKTAQEAIDWWVERRPGQVLKVEIERPVILDVLTHTEPPHWPATLDEEDESCV